MLRNNRRCHCMNNASMNEVIENEIKVTEYYEDNYDLCECGFEEDKNMFPTNVRLGQSYVPYQQLDKTFKPCVGLKMGTIFPELVSPYMPCENMANMEYLAKYSAMKEGCNRL